MIRVKLTVVDDAKPEEEIIYAVLPFGGEEALKKASETAFAGAHVMFPIHASQGILE